MMRPLPVSAFLLVAWFCLAGCSSHHAYVRGIAGEDVKEPIPKSASICVALSPDGKDWEFNDEIAKDIETLLSHNGYQVSDSTNAEYFLFFDFDRKPMMTRARLDWSGGVQSGLHTTRKEGPFDLSISLRLIESQAYHSDGLETFTWTGAAVLSEAPTESPKLVHLLLIAAFETFAEDNGEAERMKIGFYDSRAKKLREN